MISFEGQKSFPLAIGDVAARLSDAGYLAHCLPDAVVAEATPDKAAWKLKPRLSFFTGSLGVEMIATARAAGQSVAFRVFAKGIGASSTVLTALIFQQQPGGGTTVQWTGELTEVTGLLKMVPKGLLQATAQKVIEDVWAAVEAKLNEAPGARPA